MIPDQQKIPEKQKDAKNILVIKHGAFGDIIQSDGAFQDIRENHPGATITMLTTAPYRSIMERCPWVDQVFIDDRAPRWSLPAMWRLRKMLRRGRFDMVYDLQNSPRTTFYYRWFLRGTPWSGTAHGCSHPHLTPKPKTIRSLERFAGQLRDAGLQIKHTLHPDASWIAGNVGKLLSNSGIKKPYIVLIPGSSARHPKKRWPHYGALASQLLADGLSVVTVPGPDEIELCRRLPGTVLMGAHGTVLGWFDLAGILKNATFVVGNDTGPTHLAAHMNVPGIALFGSHMPAERTGIERPTFQAIQVPRLRRLGVDRVYQELKRDLINAYSKSA